MEAILGIEVKSDPCQDEENGQDKEDSSEAAATPAGFIFGSFKDIKVTFTCTKVQVPFLVGIIFDLLPLLEIRPLSLANRSP